MGISLTWSPGCVPSRGGGGSYSRNPNCCHDGRLPYSLQIHQHRLLCCRQCNCKDGRGPRPICPRSARIPTRPRRHYQSAAFPRYRARSPQGRCCRFPIVPGPDNTWCAQKLLRYPERIGGMHLCSWPHWHFESREEVAMAGEPGSHREATWDIARIQDDTWPCC